MFLASLSRRALAFCFAFAATAAALIAQTPSAADGYEPNFDGTVIALATQADGKIILAGQFAHYQRPDGIRVQRNNLARLNADGTLDESFNPNANGPVRAVVIESDGQIVIAGDFSTLQPGSTAINRGRIARLNADGSVDTAFSPSIANIVSGQPFTAQVFALLLQPDGRIVAGGSFNTVTVGTATVTRSRLVRFNADGSLDAGFDPNPNSTVLALAQHVDNKIVVAGGFTSFQEAGRSGATVRNRIARLNPNGTLDTEFNPNADNGVATLLVQRDGKIVLGGHFTTLQPIGNDTAANRSRIGRLNVDGTLDSEFYPNANGPVFALALQADGSLLVGGVFSTVWGRGSSSATRANAARFNPDGSLDTGFAPNLNAQVNAFALQPDGKVVVGGLFTRAIPVGGTSSLLRNHLARLNTNGSLDTTFELDAGGRILVSAAQANGQIVVGGTFTNVGGATHNYLARLNADGSIDATYSPDLNGRVNAIAYESGSNKMIVGGVFTTIGGETRNHIARLNPNGTIDSEFNPNLDGEVYAIAVQSDGKILVAGAFTTVQPIGAANSSVRNYILRLNANGSLDTAFHPNANSTVHAIALQSDGQVLISGLFTALTPDVDLTPVTTTSGSTTTTTTPTGTTTARNFIARLKTDGTLDTNFKPEVGSRINAMAVQSDGKIVIVGAFNYVVGSDGKLVTTTNADGTKSTSAPERNRIARLDSSGNLDDTYNPNANGPIYVLALQSDGKVVIGGAFTTLQPAGDKDWTLRKYAARITTDGKVDATFNLDIEEAGGNRVDSLRLLASGQLLVGGNFGSLQPIGTAARTSRRGFARINTDATLDLAFNPGAGGSAGGQIKAIALDAENKVIAVGAFADVGGAKTTNVARYNPEGTTDATFGSTLTADGAVNAVVARLANTTTNSTLPGLAWLTASGALRTGFTPSADARLSGQIDVAVVDSGGRLIVGGSFTNLSNATGGNLLRFLPDGTLDLAFQPAPNGGVTGLAVQSDGKIVVIGSFSTINGTARNNIARINEDGSLDTSYDPNANARINALLLESDGKVIVAGAFTTLTPNAATTATTRNYIARINTDGTVDTNYDPNLNSVVYTLARQPSDGKLVVGGAFSTATPNGATTAITRNGIARFNTDGSIDQNFDPNANGYVFALAPLANGQFIVGGAFTTFTPNIGGNSVGATTRNYIARLNSDGRVDESFDPNANGYVSTIALQSDGALLIGGSFTTLKPNGATSAVTRNHLARLGSDGAIDLTFNPDVDGEVLSVRTAPGSTIIVTGNFTGLQTNGSIVIGGAFASVGGVGARYLAAINENGSVNSNFLPRPDGAVNALVLQPDAKLVVAGAFTSIAGAARGGLARFTADGALEAAFNPAGTTVVQSLALQPDGKLIVGGRRGTGSTGGTGGTGGTGSTGSGRLVRLNADGSEDASFAAAAGLGVPVLALQADGKVLAVIEGSGIRHTLVRLNANGSADPTFAPVQNASGYFDSIAVQADGRILVGGEFTIGGISHAVRLNPNGSVDATFNPAPNRRVTALALQPDGRVVLGGNFNTVGGLPRVGIARVAATSAALQTLSVSADRRTVTLLRGGTAPEIASVVFEQSSDRSTWATLGTATRAAGSANWQRSGLVLPANAVFYIRARAVVPANGTSSGITEVVREFNFANPLGGAATSQSFAFTTAANEVTSLWSIDPLSGIGAQTAVQSQTSTGTTQSTVEIVAAAVTPVTNGRAWLSNLSTRGRVTSGSPLVVGFAVSGTTSRTVVVRGVGPALASFGVGDAVAATKLEILDSAGRTVVNTSGWDVAAAGGAELTSAFVRTGAFPLPGRSGDSAALITLAPGTYTLQVSPAASATSAGTALAEIYDADAPSTTSRLLNVSTRGDAAAGNGALIGGFVISGNASARVLLRGAGPSLAQFGVTGTLSDPVLALYNAQGTALGVNDNWASVAPQLAAAGVSVGAYSFDADSKDAAVLATLAPGAYTVQVVPAGGASSGTALIEIYELP